MYEIKAISNWVRPETYIVDELAEAQELAIELRNQQYIVEVLEIEENN